MEIQSTQVCISLKSLFSRHKGIGVQFTDEPTGNLDSASSEVVIHTLEEINKKMGKTILLVTHDPIIASSCDRIIFLKDGKVKEDLKRTGDKEQFYNEIITNWC